ncbi:MAG: DegT/DnrJ/EryC1/StrS family aminotransferase, partial [Acidimicrobiia bacterium]
MSSQRATKWIPVYEPVLGELEEELVADCVRSGWVSSKGKYVTQFESEFAAFCGTKHGVATSNGTTALHLALLALGVGVGDEIIVPSLTFVATANAVVHAGATPVFADSERLSWNVDPVSVETMITPRTRGIIAVHLYGHPCDMPAILRLATEHGLFVIEDCAEAHGATSGANRVGSMGTIGCFSFYGNKIITTGEGGMVVCPDAATKERIDSERNQGRAPDMGWLDHDRLGFNYRLDELSCALGIAQLERLDELLAGRGRVAALYSE